ncbi:MAG: MerR family DNA-binding transcriptional regulator [Pseudomonadota bacterium]
MPDTELSLSAADSRTFTISELAREFGVTPRALRFYEDKDMLHPARDGMMRVYSNRDRARLKLILRGKRVGLPLADIREILDLYGLGDGQRTQLRLSLMKFEEQAVRLREQRSDIDHALAELEKGIAWAKGQLENVGPGEEDAERVAAYGKVARARMSTET